MLHVLYYGMMTAFLSVKEKMTQALHGSCGLCLNWIHRLLWRPCDGEQKNTPYEIERWRKFDCEGWTDKKRCFPLPITLAWMRTSCLCTSKSDTSATHTRPSPLIAVWAVAFDILDRRTFRLRCTDALDRVFSFLLEKKTCTAVHKSISRGIWMGARFYTSRSRFLFTCQAALCGRLSSKKHAMPRHSVCFWRWKGCVKLMKFRKVVWNISGGCLAVLIK